MKFDVAQTRTVNFRTTVEILDDEVLEDKDALKDMLDEEAFENILESFGDGDEKVIIDYLTLDWTEWEINDGRA